MTVAAEEAVVADLEYHWTLPFATRKLTLAECYSYNKNVAFGSETKQRVVFSDNAKEYAAKEHLGMLTFVVSKGGTGAVTDANALISVTYIDPAPSSISQGSISRNNS